VAVGVDGEVVWAEGFGWANLEERLPVTPDTPFRIGTASKALTSAAIGLLMEDGRLKLDEEIQTYVPAFPKKEWPVTLRQLMGHLAGVRRDAGDEEPVRVRCDQTLGALPRFADKRLLFEPGTQFRYSNYGWILLSAAIEAAAEERYFTFMRRHIFEPIGMTRTSADAGTPPADLAVYYFPRFAANPYYGPQERDDVDYSCFAGSSAFLSTPSDLIRFVAAMNSGKLLRPETVQLLQTSQRLTSGQETGYGLGWDLETVDLGGTPTRVIGYDGTLRDGIVMSLLTLPGGLTVVAASNISFADTPSIAVRIADAFSR
jgi:CubicO group peptidase (beta-lactamase class C family)